ncbi:hypothetical protein G3N96_04555 [Burkholderia sp. Se-20373]|uniref:hypothetical protein n=1 Tax=Burkholderia sp. Se-20373 TaxID=2703898 RepID=UPI00197FB634|nr:hypothetical protein [Burkholderia sp. Se-20373]MBN3744705.1 hypothetical protein [Burkholderia sp. Se-20373]
MTTLVQIAPGVVFAAEVINPMWGQSVQAVERPTTHHGVETDQTQESHDQEVSKGGQGEQMALL